MSNEKLLINDPKSNNSEVMSNKQIDEMENLIASMESNAYTIDWGTDARANEEEIAKVLYNAGYRKQEWISVDERLPNREGKYLVCTTNGNIGVGNFIDYYGKGTHLCFACWAVTHWMPLPEPPKKGGGE